MSKEKIKPCPFCECIDIEVYSAFSSFIRCKNCSGCVNGESKEEAIKKWNIKIPEDDFKARLKEFTDDYGDDNQILDLLKYEFSLNN